MMAAVVVVNKIVNDGEKLFCEMAKDAATDIRQRTIPSTAVQAIEMRSKITDTDNNVAGNFILQKGTLGSVAFVT